MLREESLKRGATAYGSEIKNSLDEENPKVKRALDIMKELESQGVALKEIVDRMMKEGVPYETVALLTAKYLHRQNDVSANTESEILPAIRGYIKEFGDNDNYIKERILANFHTTPEEVNRMIAKARSENKNENHDSQFKDKREQALVEAMRGAIGRGDKSGAQEFALALKQEGYSSKWWDEVRKNAVVEAEVYRGISIKKDEDSGLFMIEGQSGKYQSILDVKRGIDAWVMSGEMKNPSENANAVRKNMITVKVTWDNGDVSTTGINADIEGAKNYYLGKEFNLGYGGKDVMVKAVKVEEVGDNGQVKNSSEVYVRYEEIAGAPGGFGSVGGLKKDDVITIDGKKIKLTRNDPKGGRNGGWYGEVVENKNSSLAPGDIVKFVNGVDSGDESVRMKILEVNGDRVLVEDTTAPFGTHTYPTKDIVKG